MISDNYIEKVLIDMKAYDIQIKQAQTQKERFYCLEKQQELREKFLKRVKKEIGKRRNVSGLR